MKPSSHQHLESTEYVKANGPRQTNIPLHSLRQTAYMYHSYFGCLDCSMYAHLYDLLARTASRCRRAYIFAAVVFSFFRRLISEVIEPEVTERISTKLGHMTYDCCLKIKWSEFPRAFTATGWQ